MMKNGELRRINRPLVVVNYSPIIAIVAAVIFDVATLTMTSVEWTTVYDGVALQSSSALSDPWPFKLKSQDVWLQNDKQCPVDNRLCLRDNSLTVAELIFGVIDT